VAIYCIRTLTSKIDHEAGAGSSISQLCQSGKTIQYPTMGNWALNLKPKHRVANNEALETFRGTLIDGVLQSNVRLGNDLHLPRETHLASNLAGQKPEARKCETKEFDRSVDPPIRALWMPEKLKTMRGPQDSSPPSDLELREAQELRGRKKSYFYKSRSLKLCAFRILERVERSRPEQA
jgi:hypothetical protein